VANKRSSAPMDQRRWLVLLVGSLAVVGIIALLVVYSQRPPQLGADDRVFRTVDALFTAVTAHDENLVRQCEQRLHACRDDGKLPPKAAAYLDRVIAKSRDGHWDLAAKSLYDFMTAQRRETAAR